MSDQFLTLIKIAGVTTLLTVLWAATVAFTYWDLRRGSQTSRRSCVWLALVVLLPFLGFAVYLVFRAFSSILRPREDNTEQGIRRETALKRPPPAKNPLHTFIASDLAMQTIADPQSAVPAVGGPMKVAPGYLFEITSETDRGREIVLRNLPVLIGRGPEVSIRFDSDLGVSRKHAEIYTREGSLRIRDLNSTHGTKVNGFAVKDEKLGPGDRIQIGSTELVMKEIEAL